MNTTSLIIEYLVAGIHILLSILFLFYSFYPQNFQNTWQLFQTSKEYATALTTIFIALSYALGVIAEPISRIIFEYTIEIILIRWRLMKYLEHHRENLHKSSLLKKYEADLARLKSRKLNNLTNEQPRSRNKNASTQQIQLKTQTLRYIRKFIISILNVFRIKADHFIENVRIAFTLEDPRSSLGKMRFYVLMKNNELYTEIESQINRLRLVRVLVIVEIIVLISINVQLNRTFLPLLGFFRIVVIVILIVNFIAIISRLTRYSRAIERAYAILVFEQPIDKMQE